MSKQKQIKYLNNPLRLGGAANKPTGPVLLSDQKNLDIIFSHHHNLNGINEAILKYCINLEMAKAHFHTPPNTHSFMSFTFRFPWKRAARFELLIWWNRAITYP